MKQRFSTRTVMTLFVITSLTAAILVGCKSGGKVYTIGFLQITENPVLDTARYALIAALEEQGFVEGKTIHIDYKSAQGDMSMIPQILQSFSYGGADMIITSGTPCMVAAAQSIKNLPIVYTVAFSLEQLGSKTPSNMCGVYDPMDMAAYIKMVRDIMPNIKTLGLPFNPSEPNARYAADMMQKECDKNGIKLVAMPVYTTNDVMDACHSLLQKNVEAFALAADNTLFLAQDAVVKIAAQSKRPLLVYDASQVERGAAAGTGVDYREWGREAGLLAARVINGISPSAIGTVALVHQQLYLNNKAATEQGVTFPDELLKRATRVLN